MSKTATCKVCGQEYYLSERVFVMINVKIHDIHSVQVSDIIINGLCKCCLRAVAYGCSIAKCSVIPEVDEIGGDRVIVLSRDESDNENGDKEGFEDARIR